MFQFETIVSQKARPTTYTLGEVGDMIRSSFEASRLKWVTYLVDERHQTMLEFLLLLECKVSSKDESDIENVLWTYEYLTLDWIKCAVTLFMKLTP